jgi:hypothetical protein
MRRLLTRRGLAAVSAVLGMVLLQVSIVVVVVSGARDQGMAGHRISATRAFYAGEAGMQMALRERVLNSDLDGDGGVGTISDDGDSGNDPVVGGARVSVGFDTATSQLRSIGRHEESRKRQAVEISGMAGPGISRRVVYCEWPGNSPKYRSWTPSGWSAAQNTVAFGPAEKQYWATIAQCPTRGEVGMAASLHGNALKAVIGTSGSWGNVVTATSNIGTTDARPFWLDYEQQSGRALLVYRSGDSSTIRYRVWDGASWSAEHAAASPLSGAPAYMRLAPRPASNQMMLYVIDENAAIGAMVWSGSSFGNGIELGTGVSSTSLECAGADWETTAGRCMVVWGRHGANQPRSRVWSGSEWEAEADMAALPAPARWVRVVRDPASSGLLAGFLDGGGRVNLAAWSGAAWGAYNQVTASASATTTRSFDIAFEGDGVRAIAAWGVSGSGSPRYVMWTGSGWGSVQTAPSISGTPLIVQLNNAVSGREIFLLGVISGGQNSLYSLRWNGSAMSGAQKIADNVSGPAPHEVFMTPAYGPLEGAGLSLVSWAEEPPDGV